jgi:hypothetical protein
MVADGLIDVVIPATRRSVNQLLWSLSQGSTLPSRVIVVTNEIDCIESCKEHFPVDVVRFASKVHPIGHADQALRRNIGIWESTSEFVMTLDDDQFAPRNLVSTALEEVRKRRIVWGHHRFIDFDQHGESLLDLPPSSGRSRESHVNGEHLWMSAYAGLMVAERSLLIEVGGYDMMFLGRSGNEDQSLGKRISNFLGQSGKIWVSEPPFAWHPDGGDRTHGTTKVNTCAAPSSWLDPLMINGVKFKRCSKPACTYRVFADSEDRLFTDGLVIPYDPLTVTLKKERI